MMKLFKPLILSIILISCTNNFDNSELRPYPIKSRFVKSIDAKPRKLSRKIGREFILLSGKDTLSLSFKYDKAKKQNYVVWDNDTVLSCKVFKYKKLWFLQTKQSDGKYWLSAFKKEGDLLYGLRKRKNQMFMLDTLIENLGVIDFEKVDDKYHISSDLKELYPHYLKHLESYIPDTIIFELDAIRRNSSGGLIEEESKIIVSPNPSDGPLHIQNIPLDIMTLKVFDLIGKLID